MNHDPFDVYELPAEVRYQAEAAHARAAADPERPGRLARDFGGWRIESLTVGSAAAQGERDPWASLQGIFRSYLEDGVSFVIGDPGEGAFVAVTPQEELPPALDGSRDHSMGDSMGWDEEEGEAGFSLGQVRKKVRVPYARGERAARELYSEIRPLADVAIIVGSVRRKTLEVGDVELVVLPKDLRKFVDRAEKMGFEGGDRIRHGTVDGVKAELYIAHRPEELGAMVLMYTGDYLLNIALRSRALRMGVHLDQYGIYETKRGKKRYVFQSPDEREFFDYLGMAWHNPEERSLAWRSRLGKMAGELLAAEDLPRSERSFLEAALRTLRKEKYLSLAEQAKLDRIYNKRMPEAIGLRGIETPLSASLGASELVEMGRPSPEIDLAPWQEALERRGLEGRVRRIFSLMDEESLRLWVEADAGGLPHYYLSVLRDMPEEAEVERWREEPEEWMREASREAFSTEWDGPYPEAW
jgi:hypothetical protein